MSSARYLEILPRISPGGGPGEARWRGLVDREEALHHASAGRPPREIAGRNEIGFTLVEMLVALAIFSLAAMALLRLEGATVTTTALLQEQALAQTVARNLAVEVMTDPEPPAFGATKGEAVNAGRKWRWVRIVGRSPEPRIQLIRIEVRSERGPEAANLILFRRGPR